ncbi:MAG: thioesterase [Tissierellia bacterium]|nr:thioesterase [Tissierellia bacterium]
MYSKSYRRVLGAGEREEILDPLGQLDLKKVLVLFQKISVEHDSSSEPVIAPSQSWMLYSWNVDLHQEGKLPKEGLLVETTVVQATALYVFRRFRILTPGEVFASAYGQYVLTDLKKRRMVKIPREMIAMYADPEFDAASIIPRKVKVTQSMTFHQTREEFVDDNGHIGNYFYVDFLREGLEGRGPTTHFDIIYSKELLHPQGFAMAKTQGPQVAFTFWDEEQKRIHTSGHLSFLTEEGPFDTIKKL